MRLTQFFTMALLAASLFAATPAEQAVRQAAADIEKQPAHYPHYNALAMAYARRARESGDVQFYAKAEDALEKSFAISPDNFEGMKVRTFLQLESHEYARALESATKLNKLVPDDVSVYGYLADANAELGNYQEAIAAAQWMLDLRPGNVGGFIHAAYLRELYGRLTGAIELMQMAYDATPPAESEDRAWMLSRRSHLELLTGDLTKAESSANTALRIFPDYHFALAALAQVRLAQGRHDEAVTLLRKRYEAAPRPENLYALAQAQEIAGQLEEARSSFRKFEASSLAESELPDNSNRELIAYYVDHAKEPAKALEIARKAIALRHDIFTLDSYAWALAANGEYAEADRQMQAVLAIGVKDPSILHHAGWIAMQQHNIEKAQAR